MLRAYEISTELELKVMGEIKKLNDKMDVQNTMMNDKMDNYVWEQSNYVREQSKITMMLSQNLLQLQQNMQQKK